MSLELEGAERVRHALDGVGLAVGEVVGRVDAPRIAGAWVRRVDDPIEDGVAQVDVGAGHVDPRPQDTSAVGELAVPHPLEEVQVLRHRPVPPWAVAAGFGQRAAVVADLVGR